MHFLISYHRREGRTLRFETFAEEEFHRASTERFSEELKRSSDPEIEVVVISAPSQEALEATHGRYFRPLGQLADDLRAHLSPASAAFVRSSTGTD